MTHLVVVFSNPVEGAEEEYNRWYDEVHVPDMCAVPGIKSGRRFKLAEPHDGRNYAVVLEIEAEDPETVLAEAGRRMAAGMMEVSPALDRSSLLRCLLVSRS